MGKIIENYSLQEMVGQGVYGKVFRAINIKTKEEVAVKVIKAEKFRDIPKLEQCTLNQINTLLKIEEKDHIVRYIDMLKTANNYYFVYEYCNEGTLEKVMQSYRNTAEKVMPESKAISYFTQIVNAFKVLTKYNIMHRDLKPDNILMHNGVIKIGDFGFCKSLSSPEDMSKTMLGSPIYMAPEVLKGEIYTMKADIWSLGVVLYEMLIGQCPYKSNSIAKLIQVLESSQAVIPKTSNPNLQKLLRRMLVKDPNRRIEWSELFNFKLAEESESKNTSSTFTNTSNNSLTYPISKDVSSTSSNSKPTNYLRNTTKNVQTSWQQQQEVLSQDGQLPRKRSPTHRSDVDSNPAANNSLRVTLATTSNMAYISRSPMLDTSGVNNDAAVDHFLSSHRKVGQIVRLSLDACEKPNRFASIVSYTLAKAAEKQLMDLSVSLKKESDKPTCNSIEQSRFREFKKVIDKELDDLQPLLNCYRDDIAKGPDADKFPTLLANRNRYLKMYIQGMKLDCDDSVDSFVHASQLLDYFQQSLILKKDAYQRLTKQQLNRQINSKLIKL